MPKRECIILMLNEAIREVEESNRELKWKGYLPYEQRKLDNAVNLLKKVKSILGKP